MLICIYIMGTCIRSRYIGHMRGYALLMVLACRWVVEFRNFSRKVVRHRPVLLKLPTASGLGFSSHAPAHTAEARKLEHHYPRALKVKYRESQQESS